MPTTAPFCPGSTAAPDLPRGSAHAMHFGPFPITETASFPPAAQSQCWVYVTLNAEIALMPPDNPPLQALLQSPRARISVDGQWIWWALRRKYGGRPLRKLSGSDLIHQLAALCAGQQRRLFLLGASPRANALAVQRLRQDWPGLEVGGYAMAHYAPGGEQERDALARSLAAVRAFRADYVVLALGPDKQYGFAWNMAREVDGQVCGLLCFGGAVEMASGLVRRAPLHWQQLGLESIYRVLQQPARARRWFGFLRILPRLALGRY